jgi:hypothetical protein
MHRKVTKRTFPSLWILGGKLFQNVKFDKIVVASSAREIIIIIFSFFSSICIDPYF